MYEVVFSFYTLMNHLLCIFYGASLVYTRIYNSLHTHTHEVIIIGNCVVFKWILDSGAWDTSMRAVVL